MASPEALIAAFNRLYYNSRVWSGRTHWLGVPALKLPTDLWTVQEILVETRPEVFVESGVHTGGSTLYYACVFDQLGAGEVVGIDIDLSRVPARVREHQRVTLVEGSSVADEVLAKVHELVAGRRAMVALDSDHSAEHV